LPKPFRSSRHRAKQFTLQDELPFLVLLARLVRLVILPPYTLIALLAVDIPNQVSSCRHVPLGGIGCSSVDDVVEEEGLAVLAAEVAADDVVVGGEVGLAVLAPEDLRCVEVNVVGEAHFGGFVGVGGGRV
jgi:hypothetical protein